MADVKSINGYNIKDATARTSITNLTTTVGNNKTTTDFDAHNRITNAENLQYDYANKYHMVELPETMDDHFKKLTILESYNKEKYDCIIDVEALKNSGGNTYYVDVNYTTPDSDGSEAHPWKRFQEAFAGTSNGDTIIVKKGKYTLSQFPTTATEKKNINIICEKGTLFVQGTNLTWTQNSTYTNVYQASRTRASIVIDLRKKDENIFPKLNQKSSIEEVAVNKYSYYIDSTNNIVYVNIGEEVTNDKVVVNLDANYCPLYITPYTQNLKMYIENVTILAGTGTAFARVDATEEYSAELTCVNCQFLYGGKDGSLGCMTVGGANTVFINCKAMFNKFGDGFTYHTEGGRYARGIEINCEGAYNGFESTSGTSLEYANNGSTTHERCQIVRINGNYHNNKGCNVGDTGGQNISINYGCKAYNSEVNVVGHNRNADFGALSSSAKMYLYSCFAQGKSEMNIYSGESNNIVNVYNCLYNTTGGNGTINIVE